MNDFLEDGRVAPEYLIERRSSGQKVSLGIPGDSYSEEEIDFLRTLYSRIGPVLREFVKSARAQRVRTRAQDEMTNAPHPHPEPREPLAKARLIEQSIPLLTDREVETAHWITEGKSNHEIAMILGISRKTVDKHIEHLYRKADVESRYSLMSKIYSAHQSVIPLACVALLAG